jgi:hypothetical protein
MFSLRDRFIASEIWMRGWVFASLVLAVGSLLADVDFSPAAVRSPWFVAPMLLAIPVTVLLTLIVSPIFGYAVFGGMVDRQTRRNGGPFTVGDRVVIIPGRNSGRTATVTSWGQCQSLRITIDGEEVELGGYRHYQLKRVES